MKTKELTLSAILTALITIFTLAVIYDPLTFAVGIFISASGVIILTMNTSLKATLIACAGSFLFVLIYSDIISAVTLSLFMIILPGIITGLMMKTTHSFSYVLIRSSLLYTISIVGIFWVAAAFAGSDFGGFIRSELDASIAVLSQADTTGIFKDNIGLIKETALTFIPSMFISFAALFSFAAIMISAKISSALGQKIAVVPSFSSIATPRGICFSYFLFSIIQMFITQPQSMAYVLLTNTVALISIMLFVNGLSLTKFFLNKIKAPKAVRNIIFAALLPVAFILSQFVVFAAILDSFWNLRRIGNGV